MSSQEVISGWNKGTGTVSDVAVDSALFALGYVDNLKEVDAYGAELLVV